jgi:hypothetical protein
VTPRPYHVVKTPFISAAASPLVHRDGNRQHTLGSSSNKMPPRQRGKRFKAAHLKTYGLTKINADPTKVRCSFCYHFGWEEKVGSKRKQTKNVASYERGSSKRSCTYSTFRDLIQSSGVCTEPSTMMIQKPSTDSGRMRDLRHS